MITVWISIFLLFSGLFVLVPPNTYLSQVDISYWPKPLVKLFLDKSSREAVDIAVDGITSRIKYSDLDITLNTKETMNGLRIVDLSDLLNRWLSPASATVIQPVFVFGQDFENRVTILFPGKTLKNERVEYNKETGVFDYMVDERKSRIDLVDLQAKLMTFRDTKKKTIAVEMINESNGLEKMVGGANRKLSKVTGKPLELLIKERGQKIILDVKEILGLISAETQDRFNSINLNIDKDKAKKLLADKGLDKSMAGWTTKMIEENLKLRYQSGTTNSVVLGIDNGPNTGGEVADRYLEVDLSQQRMFLFEGGNLSKSYKVSTGLNYPTPVGNYKIKNKLEMGFSNIFNVWMPWWMAFDYREDIGAYLGIHELPYKFVDGQKIYRFGNYIGNKKTGGCIALSPGESKEVYDKAFPGMDLVIFQ